MINYMMPNLSGYLERDYKVAEQLIDSLFYRFSYDLGPTSLPYWMDKFSNEKQANRMILALAHDKIITTNIVHNYAQISINKEWLLNHYTVDELNKLITSCKVDKYRPRTTADKKPIQADEVKLPSGTTNSGLVRYGFAEAGYNVFKYDTILMTKYYKEIVKFTSLAMEKIELKLNRSLRIPEGYDYQSIIKLVIDGVIANPQEEYALGELLLDSRGRAIYEVVRTIWNPISNKMARALVVSPAEVIEGNNIDNVYMFISELLHGFEPDIPAKIRKGKFAYLKREYRSINIDTEDGLKELFENIWLERLYSDVEAYISNPGHLWTTPLEVDFSSSNLVIIGLALGHNEYIDASKYMWQIDGLHKNHVKFAQTPYVFGSSASVPSLWRKNELDFTTEQVLIMKREQSIGKFAIANEFKDIIINHCHPTAKIAVTVGHETFIVECNRYKNVGDTTRQYIVYDTEVKSFKVIHHTDTHKVPDLKQFRRYFVTGFVHNYDSQILDNICLNMDWILPIHDAGLVTPNGATHMRELAVREMNFLRNNRKKIVYNYLKSINIDQAGLARYAKLLHKIEQLSGGNEIVISKWLLK